VLVHEVEVELVFMHRAEDANRQVHEAERDRTGPERAGWHGARPSRNLQAGNGRFVRAADPGSSERPMAPPGRGRSVALMKRRLIFFLLVTGLLLLALGGWTIQGLRFAVSGRRRLPQPA
jgi:hypothetical protein